KQAMERELFGDSDSDWDELDGEDKQALSQSGRDLKRIIRSRDLARVAHTPRFGMPDDCTGGKKLAGNTLQDCTGGKKLAGNTLQDCTGGKKLAGNTLQCSSSSSEQGKASTPSVQEEPSLTEAFSKIRIVNPLVSHSLMKMRMEGRKMISISRIHLKMKTQEVQGDWVTIGVVVGKSDPKTSSAGNAYSIWKLNDLADLEQSVGLFLFGEKHKQLWKTEVGAVIGLLNPAIMDAASEKSCSEPALTVQTASQVMLMGRSKDLAWCTALTKGGNKCCRFVDGRQGSFCAYHVQAAYRKQSARRLELHGSVNGGLRPRSFEKKLFSKDCAYMYGGQTFVPHSRADSGKAKKGLTLSKLESSLTEGRYTRVNTLSISDIKPTAAGGARVQPDSHDTFLDMISVPTAGSMNFVSHLKNQSSKPPGSGGSAGSKTGGLRPARSVSAKDLIRLHKQDLERRRLARHVQPQLGKGLRRDGHVLLGVAGTVAGTATGTVTGPLKAIAMVKQSGGIKKQDPNAIKKTTESVKERVKRRVEEDCGRELRHSASAKPPKKKSKLLGDVDLNSDEVKALLKAKSKHKGVLAEAEAQREDAYFAELEKKEMLEEKMQSITSIEITVVTCRLCMYTAQSAKDSCKKEGHALKRSKARKRFFRCRKCKHRTHVINAKFPT
ncbi:hypothetical protein EGW08_014247, partial [Elysia chlorotica]